ncbi:MAG: putative molybdenum carrier protein [Burkholderiales bacterium]|nr:putative molybdenum carrier protein [Burkholderiales bacterium]
MLNKIISGGQSGADRAALDAAIKFSIPHGGWCPAGRQAELGEIIPEQYLLRETKSDDVKERTVLNIIDSDGTLIFIPNQFIKLTDGTNFTITSVKLRNKPYLVIDLSDKLNDITLKINSWLTTNQIRVLNIAGPRESQYIGIYKMCFNTICHFLEYFMHNKF